MNKKLKNIWLLVFLFGLMIIFSSCQKEVPKELMDNNKPQTQTQNQNPDMPNDSIHNNLRRNTSQGDEMGNDEEGDTKAVQLMKDADDADEKYQQTKSEADKKECINKQLTAANYLMFEANLPSKKKYRPALKRYRRVLELDPSNKEAKDNKEQIEEIYESMGMPIPNS